MNISGKGSINTILFFIACFFTAPVFGQNEVNTTMSYDATVAVADRIYYDALKERMLGRNGAAEDLMLQFLKSRPDVSAAYFELSKINAELNKLDKADGYIKKAIELDSNNKAYREQYAAILVGKNDFAGAAAVLDDISKKQARKKDYLLNASVLYQKAGKDKEALVELNKALSTGSDEEILVRKEQIFAKLNSWDSAIATIYQLISIDPKEGKYYALLAEILDNNGKHDKALEVYQKATKELPDDFTIQLSLVQHYLKSGDTVLYKQYFKKAILNRDIDAQTQVDLLYDYLRGLPDNKQRIDEGMELAQLLLKQHPDNAKLLDAFGDMFSLNGENLKAVEQYKRSVAIDKSQLRVWIKVLQSYSAKQDADSLIAYGQKALRLFPNSAQVNFLCGIGHMNKKNYPDAIAAFNRAIDMQPEEDTTTVVQMYSILGDVYNTTKQYALSDSCLNHALRLMPSNDGTLNNYAYYLSERGTRLEDAEKMSKRSLTLHPDMATYLDTYGWILYKEAKYDKAKEYIEKAIAADPNADGTVWGHLGDILFKIGDINKAVEYWQKAKEKNTDDPLIDKKINDRKLYE